MMPSETDLLHDLDDEPRRPSTVDVQRAIADGRRRSRVRVAGYAGVAALTAVGLVGAAVAVGRPDAGPPRPTAADKSRPRPAYTIPGTPGWRAPEATPPSGCVLDRLPVPDGEPMALVSGADPNGGFIVGRTYPAGGGYQAVIWHDGTVRKVRLPGELEEMLRDVNTTGTAVGDSWAGTGEADRGPVPYAYRDGRVVKLAGAARGSANAVNDAGAIVGDGGGAALVWPSMTAAPIKLPVPAGTKLATATDIDEDGTTVGTIDDQRPYVWFADGTHRELTMPALDGERAPAARVLSVRDGWATGVATDLPRPGSGPKKGVSRAEVVRWNVRTGEVVTLGESKIGTPRANAHGWRVGTDEQGRAILVTEDRTVVLPDLAAHEPGGLGNIATTVSDDGRVVAGQSDDASGTIRAVVWRCR